MIRSIRNAIRELRSEAQLANDQRALALLTATLDSIDWAPRHPTITELPAETAAEFAARVLNR